MKELRIKIDDLTKKISKKTTIINNVIKNYEEYYNVVNNIIIEYNKKIIKDIDKIINEKDEDNKNTFLSKIYQKLFVNNEFILKYKLGKVICCKE